MPASTEPRSGVKYGWDYFEDHKPEMDANLLLMGRLLGGGVIDRSLTAPPGGESDGDAYIPAATATGAWAGQEDSIAIYNGSGWDFIEPSDGFGIYILDEDVWSVYKTGSGWSDGVAHSWT